MAPHTRKKEMGMSSKPTRNGSTEAEATQAETGEVPVQNSARDEGNQTSASERRSSRSLGDVYE